MHFVTSKLFPTVSVRVCGNVPVPRINKEYRSDVSGLHAMNALELGSPSFVNALPTVAFHIVDATEIPLTEYATLLGPSVLSVPGSRETTYSEAYWYKSGPDGTTLRNPKPAHRDGCGAAASHIPREPFWLDMKAFHSSVLAKAAWPRAESDSVSSASLD